jgi:hypothetical protein
MARDIVTIGLLKQILRQIWSFCFYNICLKEVRKTPKTNHKKSGELYRVDNFPERKKGAKSETFACSFYFINVFDETFIFVTRKRGT